MRAVVSIRAYGAEERFKKESMSRIDRYTRSARTFYNLNRCVFLLQCLHVLSFASYRWVSVRLETMAAAFSSGLAAYLVYGQTSVGASKVGFSLNMAGERLAVRDGRLDKSVLQWGSVQ